MCYNGDAFEEKAPKICQKKLICKKMKEKVDKLKLIWYIIKATNKKVQKYAKK